MPREDYPAQEFLPHKLTSEELADPYKCIDYFFKSIHMPEIREDLKAIFDSWIAGDFSRNLSKMERADLIYFFRMVEKMIEASYAYYLQKGEIKTGNGI